MMLKRVYSRIFRRLAVLLGLYLMFCFIRSYNRIRVTVFQNNDSADFIKIVRYMCYEIVQKYDPTDIVELHQNLNSHDLSVYLNYMKQSDSFGLEMCPLIARDLVGQFKPDLRVLSEDEVEAALSSQNISLGGKWSPTHCTSQHHIAIIIPYRNRYEHLKQFLVNMHPLFARQLLYYGLYLIEPVENVTFNRGLLFNIGFIESNKDHKWQCHSYHDVDLLSEDDRTLYACYDQPMHMAHRINKFNYNFAFKSIVQALFGGVTILKPEHYINCNGYSNRFFGWGGEDDDHFDRLVKSGHQVIAPPKQFNHYLMAKHKQETPNEQRHAILFDNRYNYKNDGVNTVKYKIIETVKTKLYTKLLVTYDTDQ